MHAGRAMVEAIVTGNTPYIIVLLTNWYDAGYMDHFSVFDLLVWMQGRWPDGEMGLCRAGGPLVLVRSMEEGHILCSILDAH